MLKESCWGTLTTHGGAVHDFELGYRLGFVVLVGWCAGRFTTDDGEFHVFDLDAHEEEVDLADDDVFQVVPVVPTRVLAGAGKWGEGGLGFVVFEFDV